ncbi:MAG: PAS domain S-box protein, partial [Desulfobacteraceae bacterium]|nr:PAS domain S-box protein [Desulfobacteraceae bacterium]
MGQTRKKHQTHKKNLDDIIEHLPVGIGILDSHGNILRLNQTFKKMFGYTEKDISTVEDWAVRAYPDKDYREKTIAVWNQYINDAFETGLNTPPLDVEIFCKDKTTRNVLISLQPGDNQHLTTFVDITGRKKAEAQAARLMSAVEQAAEMFVITDTDGIIQYVNPAFEQITGYTVKEAVGSTPRILKSGRQDRAFYRSLWRTILSGSSWQGRMTNKKKDGSFYIEDMVISPVFDPGGDIVNFVAVKRDLTSIIKMEETLHQAQKMESIGSLAGGIAHDFNNLLFPIVGLSEMMLADFPPDSPEHQNLHEIFLAGKRGRELVQQILSFSRQSEHQQIPVHIQKVLKEVLKLCRATIPTDIPITRDIQADCGPVMADPTQIHQIAMNLITNAYHAVEPAGGTISIQLTEMDVDQTDDPVGDLVPVVPGRYAMLSISDTGTGIDPAVISKIFDPYFTTKEKGRGTGLGLATVYGIVKAYGGEITVHSDIGKGTTFHVFLPLLEKAQEPETEKEITSLPTGTEHILLVDDEAPIVHLEKQMLARLGYRITDFSSSADALAAFRADPTQFDLVITDMNMPHLTGMQLTKELIAVRPDI